MCFPSAIRQELMGLLAEEAFSPWLLNGEKHKRLRFLMGIFESCNGSSVLQITYFCSTCNQECHI